MCGIAGFTRLRAADYDAGAIIRKMTLPLAPRGPDGEGYWVDERVAFGHRRLSIIDLAGGAQPMATPDGRYHITFNGEIYNYVELRAAMEQEGVSFVTHSDTEVILQQFARSGAACLQHFNGMFAFAIWDREQERLFVARDRLGVKPLYYCLRNGELIFASELKALLPHPALERRLDPLSVSKYFTYGYVPAPHTIFKDVYKLQPGTCLMFDRQGLRQEVYWDIPLEDNPVNDSNVDECAEGLLALLRDAVVKRLRSDVPVGVFLSGGLDSSTITALAAGAVSGRLHTFSVGFGEKTYDESPYARQVAQQYGTEHHHEILSASDAVRLLPGVMKILDEPFADASILPTWMLSQFASRSVKVVLGGDGSDELFAGYPSFQAHRLMERLSFLPIGVRDGFNRLVRRLPVSHRYASLEFLLQQLIKGSGVSPEIRFLLWMGYYGNEQKRQLFAPGFRDALLRTNAFEDAINYVRQSGLFCDFERLQYLCLKMYMQDDILVKVDRASMANGLEVRGPFLDYQVVEYASRIKPEYKLRGLRGTKYILKHAVRDLLPARIIHRRKAGFMIPLAQWLSNELRPLVEEMCSEDALRQDGLFDPIFVRRMLDDHYAQRRDYRKMIWALLAFQIWRNNYGALRGGCI
jgi:asparagine synthase (glutamine-hydrolysing)